MNRWKAHVVRLPDDIASKIQRVIKRDRSTISQFLRTAAIEKLNRTTKTAV